MATKMTRKLRNEIATLSTGGVGTYYSHPGVFFASLERVLQKNELSYEDLTYPLIYTSEGRGRISVVNRGMDTPLFDVVYTWYRMPSSNWEIICYPSC